MTMSPHNRMLFWCYLLHMFVLGTCTYSFEFEVNQPGCANMHLQSAVNNQVAYNIIYTWNRFGVIHDWKFEPNPSASIKGLHCVRYSFMSQLQLPDFFQTYLNSVKYGVRIHKDVCSKGNVLTEVVHVDDTSVLTDFDALEVSTWRKNELTSTVTVSYNLPWYFVFLQSAVETHLKASFRDKLMQMKKVLCAVNGAN